MFYDESRRVSRIVGGLLLLLVGGLFLLENFGVLHASHRLTDFWPLFLVWAGLARMFGHGGRHLASGVVILLVGVAFQLDQLGAVWLRSRDFWPLLLVAAGVALVTESLFVRRAWAHRGEDGSNSSSTSTRIPRGQS
jgi:hypothetical protein